MSLTIIPLGTGSAFSKNDGQSNFLIYNGVGPNPTPLGWDFGGQWPQMMHQYCKAKNLPPWFLWLKKLYLSHNHDDHNGGGEEIAFTSYFIPDVQRPELYGNSVVLKDAWEKSWKGGLESLSWGQLPEEWKEKPIDLSLYFDPYYIPDNGSFKIEGNRYEPFQVEHVRNKFSSMPCYGTLITTLIGTRVMITSDTQFNPTSLLQMYDGVDEIWHDCETGPIKSGVHAHFDDLCTLDDSVKEKMILYHYNENHVPDWKNNGFKGIAEAHKEYKYA